ncbi:MAG: hypothetical protein MRK01_04660 [Candidatus Scalindua sp.]|nr:hypothetical protein [Candidatus Scalindua sp.]
MPAKAGIHERHIFWQGCWNMKRNNLLSFSTLSGLFLQFLNVLVSILDSRSTDCGNDSVWREEKDIVSRSAAEIARKNNIK